MSFNARMEQFAKSIGARRIDNSIKLSRIPKLQYVTQQRTIRTCQLCRGTKLNIIIHTDVLGEHKSYDNCKACRGTGLIDWSRI